MVEPHIAHIIVFGARDGRDLGEDVLAHPGVPDTEIFIDVAAARHELDGAGERGIRSMWRPSPSSGNACVYQSRILDPKLKCFLSI